MSQPFGEVLKSLPPDLPTPPDRFERVRSRVRRRRRVQVAGVLGALVLGGVAFTGLLTRDGGGTDRGIDPADPVPSQTQEVLPGGDKVVPLSDPVVDEGQGTETIDLGIAPSRANAIATELTCRSAGRFKWPDGAVMVCSSSDIGEPSSTARGVVALQRKQSQFVIKAKPGVQWTLVTYFVRTETTPWGVNEKGETFGVENDSGEPDLIAVVASNGRRGYVYADELDSATGGDVSTPKEAREWMKNWPHDPVLVDVYEFDGETLIGQFVAGSSSGLATAG